MQYEELNQLLDILLDAISDERPKKGYWRELWELASRIRRELRETSYPSPIEKRDAINRLNELEMAARRRSEEEKKRREALHYQMEQKIERSNKTRSVIEKKTQDSRPESELERMIFSIILAPIVIIEDLLCTILGIEQLDKVLDDLKCCSGNMKEAWRLFSENKNELLPGDKNELYKQLKDAQERLNSAWEQWKDQKNHIREEQRRAWEIRQQKWDEKHRQYIAKVEANIEKLKNKISRAEDALEHKHEHLEDLKEKYREAWNDDFRERCGAWIEETEEKIQSIEDQIEQWKEWLDEEQNKLAH